MDPSRFARDKNLGGMLRWTASEGGFHLLTADGRVDTRRGEDDFGHVAQELVADLLSAQARNTIRRATRAALAARRDNGLVAGHVPYGYRCDGARLEPDPGEQATVRRVLDLRDSAGRCERSRRR